GPDATTEKMELRKHIKRAVDQLSEKQKKVFILRYYDELSHAEIAQITGNSEGTIKANFFHAMNKVQAYLEKHYFEKGKPHA
ncbi:MAG TPA: RNA polymerase sigma factor, partial [bacterium]|nr:RNA polymerase sigma factor [bacterium]